MQAALPAIAPVLGAWLVIAFSWPSTFWLKAAVAAFTMLALQGFKLPTAPPHDPDRPPAHARYWRLMTARRFMGYQLSHAMAFAGLIVFIMASALSAGDLSRPYHHGLRGDAGDAHRFLCRRCQHVRRVVRPLRHRTHCYRLCRPANVQRYCVHGGGDRHTRASWSGELHNDYAALGHWTRSACRTRLVAGPCPLPAPIPVRTVA